MVGDCMGKRHAESGEAVFLRAMGQSPRNAQERANEIFPWRGRFRWIPHFALPSQPVPHPAFPVAHFPEVSLPTEAVLAWIGWRHLFVVLALASLASAVLIALISPSAPRNAAATGRSDAAPGYFAIFSSSAYWRLAPLSSTTIGGAWALQGLWSGPWLRDVAHLDQPQVATYLFIMAFALCAGALGFGTLISWLGKSGFAPAQILTVGVVFYLLAELGLALDWPVPPLLLWCVVAAFAAGTVIVFTMSAQRFPKESVGRANIDSAGSPVFAGANTHAPTNGSPFHQRCGCAADGGGDP